METIHVLLDAKLLKSADIAAKRQKLNRSALIRQALQEHLKRLEILNSRRVIGGAIKPSRSALRNIVPGRGLPFGRKSESGGVHFYRFAHSQ